MSEPPRLRTAEIIAVGTEMLAAGRQDTNSAHITARLEALGIEVTAKSVAGDDRRRLAAFVRAALDHADLLILTGGLGPTDDDVTREAVADALGRELQEHDDIREAIRRRFERRGLSMPEINRRQAQVVRGGVSLANPLGTAPGMWIDAAGRVVVLLPGPPREMHPMFDTLVAGALGARTGPERLTRRTVRLVGPTESHAEERLRPLYALWSARRPPIASTILAARGQLELQLSTRGPDPVDGGGVLDAAVAEIEGAFGDDVCSTDGKELEAVVGDLLRTRGLRIAIAESCTGGLVASRLTDVPGSSDYVERGLVAYSNRAKTDLLGVAADLIAREGAVSEPVAVAMAEGARRIARAEVGVGVTGIAGPGGGTDAKPVGTVALAVAGPGNRVAVRTRLFPGSRVQVKEFSSTAAIDLVRRALLAATRGNPHRASPPAAIA